MCVQIGRWVDGKIKRIQVIITRDCNAGRGIIGPTIKKQNNTMRHVETQKTLDAWWMNKTGCGWSEAMMKGLEG